MSDIQRITEMQEALNAHMMSAVEARELYKPVPLSRSRRVRLRVKYGFKYRIPSRWRAVRRRIALWIAPELEEDW